MEGTFSGKSPLQAASETPLRMQELEHNGAEPGPASWFLQGQKPDASEDWQGTRPSGGCGAACPMGEQGLVPNR